MNSIRFADDLSVNGCRILRLENEFVSLDLMPELGGKIYRLTDKRNGRDYLWKNPNLDPRKLSFGAGYDENFTGGWDDNFPSDAPCVLDGVSMPDHGEYWTQPFRWEYSPGPDAVLHLVAEGPLTPTRMERWISLSGAAPIVHIRYRLTHLGDRAFPYIWKMHPALELHPGEEILIPGGRSIVASPGMGRLADGPESFRWPFAPGKSGGTIDLSRVPADRVIPDYEMAYVVELTDGWCAVRNPRTGTGLKIVFDRILFNNVWLFQTFGGWLGHRVVVLEPSTGYPFDLSEADRCGTGSRLLPGQSINTSLEVILFDAQTEECPPFI